VSGGQPQPPAPEPSRPPQPASWIGPLGLAVLVAGGIGFSIGVDPAEYRSGGFAPRAAPPAAAPDEASGARAPQPARTHRELSRRPWGSGPGASWSRSLELARAARTEPAPAQPDPAARARALEGRAARRAFAGAPPVVPHPTAGTSSAGCLACHGDGLQLGALRAPPLPHASYASCTQCHVTRGESGPAELPAVAVASRFRGLEAAGPGARAWTGAPPALPHTSQMRQNCLACHGPLGLAGLRTPHPERLSCLQCHALRAALEHRAAP